MAIEVFGELVFNPFFWGVGIGLMLVIMVWRSAALREKHLKSEIERLNGEIEDLTQHLNVQMKVTSKGNEQLQKELENLKTENENLRINVATLQQKPDRAEIRTLHLYDRAIHVMYENAPGFAAAWEKALREAEDYMQQTERGLFRMIRRFMKPGLPSPNHITPGDEEEVVRRLPDGDD